jgi:tetratricopeptide (TPR) repeat protein
MNNYLKELQREIQDFVNKKADDALENVIPSPLDPPLKERRKLETEKAIASLTPENLEQDLQSAADLLRIKGPTLLNSEEWSHLQQSFKNANESLEKASWDDLKEATVAELCHLPSEALQAIEKVAHYKYERYGFLQAASLYLFLGCLDTSNALYPFKQGICLQQEERHEEAIEAYLNTIERESPPINTYFFLSECYLSINDTESSKTWFEKGTLIIKGLDSLPEDFSEDYFSLLKHAIESEGGKQ